jgi:hypothetical protein
LLQKSKIERCRKSRESGFLDAATAAIPRSADAKVRGHFCANNEVPHIASRRRDRQAERLCGCEIDDQFELSGLVGRSARCPLYPDKPTSAAVAVDAFACSVVCRISYGFPVPKASRIWGQTGPDLVHQARCADDAPSLRAAITARGGFESTVTPFSLMR